MWLDEKSKQDPYNRLAGTPSTQVGAGGGLTQPGGTTANPSTQTPSSIQQPKQEFATVQDYLKGNQQQGEQLGQKVVSSLGDTLGQEKNTISNAAEQAKTDISGNTINYDPNLVTTALNDPTQVAGNTDQLGSFLKQWNAAYSGPQSFEASSSYTPAITAANEAASKKAQAETTGGQQQLIQDQFGVYGQGNKALDQTLLQNSSAFPEVQNQAKEFGNIQNYLSNQAKDVNAAATKAKETTAQTKAQTQGAFTNKLTDFQTGLNQKVEAKKADAQKVADKYKEDLAAAGKAGGNSSALIKDITDAGASPKEVQTLKDYFQGLQTYGMSGDLGNFATMNPNVDVTAANVASPEDYAKAAAYQALTGVNYGGVLNPADASKAGEPTSVPKSGRSLADLQKMADAQVKNFGSADQGLLNEIKTLTDSGSTGEMQPAKNPVDVGGLTSYLKGQVAPRDQQLLSGDLTNAISKALNINQPASSAEVLSLVKSNPEQAQTVAMRLLDAAKRSGDGVNAVYNVYQQLANIWFGLGPTNGPKATGYLQLLNTLGKELNYPMIQGLNFRIGENGQILK